VTSFGVSPGDDGGGDGGGAAAAAVAMVKVARSRLMPMRSRGDSEPKRRHSEEPRRSARHIALARRATHNALALARAASPVSDARRRCSGHASPAHGRRIIHRWSRLPSRHPRARSVDLRQARPDREERSERARSRSACAAPGSEIPPAVVVDWRTIARIGNSRSRLYVAL